MSNCPNCGAPIVSSKCEYCGTVHGRDVSSNDPCLYVEFNKEAILHKTINERLYESGIFTANELRRLAGMFNV